MSKFFSKKMGYNYTKYIHLKGRIQESLELLDIGNFHWPRLCSLLYQPYHKASVHKEVAFCLESKTPDTVQEHR